MDARQVAKYALGSYVVYAILRKLTSPDPDAKVNLPPLRKDSPKCVVIGAGISGICMSIKLALKGIDHIVIEKEGDVGGTWFLSNYPGVQCDVPSHGYCYSFEMNPDWSKAYAGSKEIWAYLARVARKYDVYKRSRFNTEVCSARWSEADRKWVVEVEDRKTGAKETLVVDYCISGIGALHFPNYPDVPGIGSFKNGREVHSAEWREDIDCSNKRVVVIGSAASAVQIVPSVAEVARQVVCVQRTPNWLAPQKAPVLPWSLKYGPIIRWCFRNLPGFLWLHRILVYLNMESLHTPLGAFSGGHEGVGQILTRKTLTRYMQSQLNGNPELASKVIPKYAVGCKRIIRSERFLPALLKNHVELVTDRLDRVEADGIVLKTKEGERKVECDLIVYATGYKVGSLGHLQLQGLNHSVSGLDIIEKALDSYYGMCHPSYPNAFLMLGPNTGLGHNSIIIMIETQANFIARTIELATDANVERISIKQEEVARCMSFIDETMEQTVWKNGRCESWYQNKDGKVPTLWPASTMRYMVDCAPPTDLHLFDVCLKGQPKATNKLGISKI